MCMVYICHYFQPPPYWPIQGSINFRNVKLRYRPNLPYALNNVSFDVEPAEKIGIVGRTGSGKSSLFLALFRIVEIFKGNIYVDGIDLHHLNLKDIRYGKPCQVFCHDLIFYL